MITSVTAAVAAAALVAILASIGILLARASFTEHPKHAPHPNAYRPRPWDEVTAETPLSDAEPIDPLDPRWDWQAYADKLEQMHQGQPQNDTETAERELIDA